MAAYNLVFDKDVDKDLQRIPKNVLRVGDYRVVYQVDNAQRQVIVYYIRHRKDVYRSI